MYSPEEGISKAPVMTSAGAAAGVPKLIQNHGKRNDETVKEGKYTGKKNE